MKITRLPWQDTILFIVLHAVAIYTIGFHLEHRHHHRFSDQPQDVHSPLHKGFLWSHMGWILCDKYKSTNQALIRDFWAYPELVCSIITPGRR
jgi:stearoyl-CoA desaturase (delta-9 desaturase)